MSNRIAKVRELLKREISSAIERDFEFPGKLVSVHEVDVTPDLKRAHVYVGVIGGSLDSVVELLNKRRGQIQRVVFKRVTLKFTPTLEFHGSDSVERGVEVISMLDQLVAENPEIADTDSLPTDQKNS